MDILGFRDVFRGLVENCSLRLDKKALAGIVTVGGTTAWRSMAASAT